jgi:hypothetical protein
MPRRCRTRIPDPNEAAGFVRLSFGGGDANSHFGKGAAAPPSAPPAVDRPQFSSGLTTPVPPAQSGDKPPFVTVEQARAYEAANDLRACQEAARQMRRAGVPMPDGLIALAALRPDLLESTDEKH